jgi:ubiquinone/menaquinone biosynthesis C-methylase UbiE
LFGKKIVSIFHCRVDLGKGLINQIINFLLEKIVILQLSLSHQVVGYTKDYVLSLGLPERIFNKIIFLPPPVRKLPVSKAKHQKMIRQKGKKIWIGFAGRVAKEKGIEHLIKSINKADLADKTELVFAGPYGKQVAGEADYYQYIKSLLKRFNIKHYFFGTLNSGELGAFYKSIDVLVLPSINQTEAFGMVQAEAMQLNTPVITTDLPGVRVLVNKTGMGLVVPPANSDKLASAIKKIISHKSAFTKKHMQEKLNRFINSKKPCKNMTTSSKPFDKKADAVISDTIDNYLNHQPPFYCLIRPQELYLFYHFRNYLKPKSLDYGCGDGFFAKLLVNHTGNQIHTGIDIKESRINLAHLTKSYKNIVEYDGHNLPSANNTFTSVMSNCVFEHLPDINQSLQEINRVLRPGGYLLTSVMTNRWEDYLAGSLILGVKYKDLMRRQQIHINLLSQNEWRQRYRQAGFSLIHEVGYLSPKTARFLDLSHYLSIGSLLSHKITGRWVPLKNWHRPFKLNRLFTKIAKQSLFSNPTQSAALFHVLKKSS